MSGPRVGPAFAALIVAVAAAAGIGGVLVWNAMQDSEVIITAPGTPGTAGATEDTAERVTDPDQPLDSGEVATTAPQTDAGLADPADAQPPAEPDGTLESVQPSESAGESAGSSDFDDELIAAAVAEGAANPQTGLPSRDHVATALLNAELASAGVDVRGMEFTIYPAGAVPSFILLTTSDATPLLALDSGASDDTASEQLLMTLFGSSVVADFEVEKLIMQHSGTDEVGPFVMTIMVRLADLEAASATGADAFEDIAIQMERP